MINVNPKTSFRVSPVGKRGLVYSKNPASMGSSFRHKFIIFLILITLLVLGAILASIFIFGHSSKEIGERLIEINFLGEDEVDSLKSNNYTILLTNKEFSDLKAAELKVNFPKDFILSHTSQPCAETLVSGCTWSLGKIKRGESRAINLEGYFLASSQSDSDFKNFNGILNFQLEDFSSYFQKEFKKDIFVKPVISVDLEGNKKISVGLKKQWRINLQNSAEQNINHPQVILETPNGFVIIPPETHPKGINFEIEGRRALWSIDSLAPTSEYPIYFDGYFSQFSERPLEFKIKVGIVDSSGQFFIQNEIIESINLQPSSLIFSLLAIEGQNTFHSGEEIPIYLKYQNISNQIEDLIFKVEISNSQFIDWSNLLNSNWQWSSGQNQIQENSWLVESKGELRTIIWDKSQIADLNKISIGNSGQIYFVLKTTSSLLNINNQEIILRIKASGKYSESGDQFEIDGTPLILKIVL